MRIQGAYSFRPRFTKKLLKSAALAGLILAPATLIPSLALSQTNEVVIYGARIPRTLADTQASVAVLGEDAIIEADIQNLRDAFRMMGNVIDSDWVDAGFVIRGVSSEGLTPGGNPLATIYVDGVPQTVQGARRGLRGLWDVNQVEVYRGPQSTISGRAALAGAIYIWTNDPTFDWDVAGRATFGTLETAEGAVVIGGPLVDDVLAFRVAAEYQRSESDINYPEYEHYVAYEDFIEDEYYQIRSKLLFQPQALNGGRALLTYSFAHDSPDYDDLGGPGFGFEYDDYRGDLNFDTPFFQANREADNHTVSLEVTYPISDMLMFTSLSSYAYTDLDRPSINAGTPGEDFVGQGYEKQTYATQEFRLNYDRMGLQWVAGLYAAREHTKIDFTRTSFFSGGRADISKPEAEAFNLAIFGEASYEFAPTWEVTLGARADYESQETNIYSMRDFFDPGTPDTLTFGTSENDLFTFLPKAGIVKSFTPEQSLGFTVQRGFRSGGAGVDFTDASAYEFDPEYVWNYELSYRGAFFENRLNIAFNAFYTDWIDQQVELQLVPGDFTSTVVLNAGSSHLYGGELEAQFAITPEFSTFLAIGHVQTQFDDFMTPSLGDFSGLPFPESPEWTVSFGADYEHASGFFVGADARSVSSYLARDLQNAPIDEVGDYFVANFRAGYRAENWSITLFSDNAFDEEIIVYKDVIGTGPGAFDCCVTLGPRRITGITLRASN